MYLIDSNIFLEILLDQERKDECRELLEAIARGEVETLVSKFTVHGIERLLSEDTDSLDKFLTNISSLIAMRIAETGIEEERQVVKLAKAKNLDFDNALQYMIAERENAEAIISFDSDFDKTDLNRFEPGEIIE